MSKQTLKFKVDGEFITDIARTWFWDEDRPEKSRELIMSCLNTDQLTDEQKEDIFIKIIEGRKKFVGINTFNIVDDNERVRLIGDFISQQQFRIRLSTLSSMMDKNPGDWVDIYSTVKSPKALNETLKYGRYSSPEDQYDYFRCSESEMVKDRYSREYFFEYDSPTMCGLWMIEEKDLVMRCLDKADKGMEITDDFWKFVYEEVKDRPGFDDRNKYYLGCVRKANYVEEVTYTEDKSLRIYEETSPDDIRDWEGLIDPKGNFYTTEFGAHNAKAHNIIRDNYDKFGYSDKYEVPINDALDILIDKGWVATRYLPTRGHYVTIPSKRNMTKAQEDRVWDAIVKFNLNYNDISFDTY